MSNFRPVTQAEVPQVPEVGIGMLGYGNMGRAHSNAFHKIPYIFWPPVARIRMVAICGRNESSVAQAAIRYGYEGSYTDWRDMVADERIQIVDNGAVHGVHADPCIAAAEYGKHVLCEKPMALTAADARRMLAAAENAGVKHGMSFNYRFAPAVRLARDIIDAGQLGRLHTIRIRYNAGNQAGPPQPLALKNRVGNFGVHMGLGSHVIDMARFLMGEPKSVSALAPTFNKHRPLGDANGPIVDVTAPDSFVAAVEFASGAIGTVEASYVCAGRKNNLAWEVNGANGSLMWDVEDLNRLQVYGAGKDKLNGIAGFESVLVTESDHPYAKPWWAEGIGWEHMHINMIQHFITAVVRDQPVAPYGATFEDGYKAAVIAEAILESSATGRRVDLDYGL